MNSPTDIRPRQTLVVVTNIPTPYRTNFFNCLQEVLVALGTRLVVLYCARSEWNRHWGYSAEENRYEHHFLPGYSIRAGSITFHLNVTITKMLRSLRPDWVLLAGAWNMPTGLLALSMRKRLGFRAIFWSEGHADAVLHKSGPIASFRRAVFRKYDAFAVPNNRSLSFLAQEMGRLPKSLFLPNTVDDHFFVPATIDQRAESRRILGIGREETLLVQVSQLEDRKGVIELAKAVSLVGQQHTRLKLAIIGTGTFEPQLRTIQAATSDKVIVLTGALDRVRVRQWLYAADAFVLASKRDPNPLASIEAAMCAKPLLLSRYVGNVQELVECGVTGYTVSEVTTNALAQGMSRLLSHSKQELVAMGAESHRRAASMFTSRNVAAVFASGLAEMTDHT